MAELTTTQRSVTKCLMEGGTIRRYRGKFCVTACGENHLAKMISADTFKAINSAKAIKPGPIPDEWVYAKPGEVEAMLQAEVDAAKDRLHATVNPEMIAFVSMSQGYKLIFGGEPLSADVVDRLIKTKWAKWQGSRIVPTTPDQEARDLNRERMKGEKNRQARIERWTALIDDLRERGLLGKAFDLIADECVSMGSMADENPEPADWNRRVHEDQS